MINFGKEVKDKHTGTHFHIIHPMVISAISNDERVAFKKVTKMADDLMAIHHELKNTDMYESSLIEVKILED